MDEPILSTEYRSWLEELKRRYRSTQIKSSIAVNNAILDFYWKLGKDISEKYPGMQYGSRFYSRLSADLRLMLPEASGLSKVNIIYCQRFYELYSGAAIVPPTGEQSLPDDKLSIVPQAVEQLTTITLTGLRYGETSMLFADRLVILLYSATPLLCCGS